jgi:nucleoside-diphosphate-sugar epimerase
MRDERNNMMPKNIKQRTVLISGATGFVGSNLACRLLKDGWCVHVISRAESHLPDLPEFAHIVNHVHDGSTQSLVDCVARAKPNVVMHLASMIQVEHKVKDVEPLIISNVLFGSQLLEAMRGNGVEMFVNTGTFWQHFNNDEYSPVCLYAATKQAFEAILKYYVEAYGIKAITLKLFDTYGPNDPRPKLFHLLNKAATSKEPLDMSSGEQLIDLVHIDDVVDAYLIAANQLLEGTVSQHETYAVSSGKPTPLKKVVQLYAEVTEQAIVVNWGARPYRVREVMVPWSRGDSLKGWSPKIKLSEGMRQIWSSGMQHLNSDPN